MKQWITAFAFCGLALHPATAFGQSARDKLSYYGDLRLRWEQDFDSVRSDGVSERQDRDRLRARLRLGVKYEASDELTYDLRIRTGDRQNPQSPHVTLWQDPSGNKGDINDITPDRLHLKYRQDAYTLIAGRNTPAFWKPNEFLWDDDVYTDGASITFNSGKPITLQGATGFLAEAEESRSYSARSTFAQGQVVYRRNFSAGKLTIAQGLLAIFDDENSDNSSMNGDEGYTIAFTNIQYSTTIDETPLTIGFDYMRNLYDYPDRLANHEDVVGYDFYAEAGALKTKGDWLFAYYYADIEQFAVNRYMAQDDWFRFDSDGQTRSSNYKGHEFRIACALTGKANLVARYYLVDTISDAENGKRFRLDYNQKF